MIINRTAIRGGSYNLQLELKTVLENISSIPSLHHILIQSAVTKTQSYGQRRTTSNNWTDNDRNDKPKSYIISLAVLSGDADTPRHHTAPYYPSRSSINNILSSYETRGIQHGWMTTVLVTENIHEKGEMIPIICSVINDNNINSAHHMPTALMIHYSLKVHTDWWVVSGDSYRQQYWNN